MTDTDRTTGLEINDFYVYSWFRPDTKEVFYIGKGRGGRANVTGKRNRHFRNIISLLEKASLKPVVTKIRDGLSEEDAFKLEVELIEFHGRVSAGGTLVNMTDGGEGRSGSTPSAEQREKVSLALKSALQDASLREKWSEAQRERYRDPSQRAKTAEAVSRRYEDPAEREKMAAPLRGVPKTIKHVQSVKDALIVVWQDDDRRERHRRTSLLRGPSKRNTSGFKGVSFDASSGKWLAQVEVDRRNKNLGRYETAEEAARAYDKGVKSFYGGDVYLNFPQ